MVQESYAKIISLQHFSNHPTKTSYNSYFSVYFQASKRSIWTNKIIQKGKKKANNKGHLRKSTTKKDKLWTFRNDKLSR